MTRHPTPRSAVHPLAPHARSTRRGLLLGAAGTAAAVGLAACGGSDGGAASSAAGGTSDAAGAFPVTVKHTLGETTIPTAPKRVVTYGYTDQDPALALGTVPVGTLRWIPQWKRGVGEWAESRLGDAKPKQFSGDQIDFEGVASVRPDLILIVNYALPKGDYDKLSKIAPTVPTVGGYPDWSVPWQAVTEQIGRALGRPAQARKLVADAEARFAKAKADHPSFAGKEVLITAPGPGGKLSVFAPTDTRGRFTDALGFTQPAAIEQATGGEFYAYLSSERLDLVDVDALIVLVDDPTTRKQLLAQPAFTSLKVVRDGRAIMVEDLDVSMALSASSVLSIPYALDRVVPRLDAALAKL
ncbi:MAG TPA: iron-siderophore ABC transporter substrate-binding protein [Baekduia sp.]|uniref:iron-siderophore ABC transporter substrate-binding protein n=1 Tax=Baekduia sp. TaxID=2600305 RepID=UPI002D775E80|nr:iron-siderophore ABC transporter substrate-binding protein [Baekduia sp.]HET6507734.1 iron-siderophore ABC transporter substrate-binding protein [Baekduia sp.]